MKSWSAITQLCLSFCRLSCLLPVFHSACLVACHIRHSSHVLSELAELTMVLMIAMLLLLLLLLLLLPPLLLHS